jgi:osmoprotectant transport system ATP-binding protein
MIRFDKVSVIYPSGAVALDGISIEIAATQFTALVGGSGSGKTTAIRLINRLLNPTAGRVFLNEQDVSSMDKVALRRSIGYVIQDIGLIPHMTVSQNVGIVPKLLGWPPARIRDTVHEKLAMVHLNPKEYGPRYPSSLSGGQKQRIGIARALAANPDILLMDEPFGALDTVLREELQDEFQEIFRQLRKTIVFVTHDMHEAVHLADRIVVLKAGQICQEGSPQDIVLRPKEEFVIRLLGRRRKDLENYVQTCARTAAS